MATNAHKKKKKEEEKNNLTDGYGRLALFPHQFDNTKRLIFIIFVPCLSLFHFSRNTLKTRVDWFCTIQRTGVNPISCESSNTKMLSRLEKTTILRERNSKMKQPWYPSGQGQSSSESSLKCCLQVCT